MLDEFEKSITVKYRAKIWSRFVKALKEYELLSPGDKVCVCISGGKDSMLMARLFMQLKKHSDFDFDVEYLVMNPGYNKPNQEVIDRNLKLLGIDAKIVKTNIFDVANLQQGRSPCFLCAKMRRGALYNTAKKLGCNKIALGHHYDDVIETTLMNMLNSGSFQTMLPKLHSTNFPGMELIRPMYFIREKDIISWKNYHNLEFIQCACKLTESLHHAEDGSTISQRYNTKQLIKELKETYNDQVEKNIFMAGSNVTLDMVGGYREGGKYHSFLDLYDSRIVHKKTYNSFRELLLNSAPFLIDFSKTNNVFVKFVDSNKENHNYGSEISLALDDKFNLVVLPLENKNLNSTIEYLKQKNESVIFLQTQEFDSNSLKSIKAKIQKTMNIKLNSKDASQFETLKQYIKEKHVKNQNIIVFINL
ncbi:MAG: hypothetical protein IJ186_00395 [Bacilli bacterium]|nr:hypothetical protein [Bacilli bacterium]